VLDACGVEVAHVVGHDWGAAVAWQVAGDHPDRLRTLTAVSVPHPTPFGDALREDEDQQLRSQYIQVYRSSAGHAEKQLLAEDALALRRAFDHKIPPSHLDEYLSRLREPGALTAALNWYRANPLQRLTAPVITVPTLYVWSTEDVAIGSTAALATDKYVSAAYRFEMVEDVSHWVPEEAPDTMTGLLLEHLTQFAR
jgi:pimeloyl-ACP methyl ester carboxylesterase